MRAPSSPRSSTQHSPGGSDSEFVVQYWCRVGVTQPRCSTTPATRLCCSVPTAACCPGLGLAAANATASRRHTAPPLRQRRNSPRPCWPPNATHPRCAPSSLAAAWTALAALLRSHLVIWWFRRIAWMAARLAGSHPWRCWTAGFVHELVALVPHARAAVAALLGRSSCGRRAAMAGSSLARPRRPVLQPALHHYSCVGDAARGCRGRRWHCCARSRCWRRLSVALRPISVMSGSSPWRARCASCRLGHPDRARSARQRSCGAVPALLIRR